MNYKMNVIITKNNNEKIYKLDCFFFYDEEQYGNKYWLSITDGKEFDKYIDIRYDTAFRSKEKEKYLVGWAYDYWNGENGAWSIKSLEIIKVID